MSYYRYKRLQQYINGQPTDVYKKGERVDDVDYSTYEACMGSSADTRWVSIPQTVCYDGDLWSMEKEQISYDGGTSWSDTGNSRRASVIEQSSAQCFMNDWRVVPGEYICMMHAKWTKEAEYVSYDGGQTWTATGNIRRGETVIELLSADCGVIYQWVPTGEYICQGYNKYMKEKQVYSTDNGSTWTDTGNRRTGGLIEADSPYCGYEEYIYQWVDVSGEYVCQGTTKYKKQKEQRSSDNGQTWEDTGNTRQGEVIEVNSFDCGYVAYRWVSDTGYVCVGYDKYNKEKEQSSTDGTNWTDTGNTRAGSNLIEHNSTDCGYVPTPITRWVADTGYVCVGYDKYNKEKEQQSTDGGEHWTDTGNTRAGSTLIETDSVDCGYPDYSTETLLEDYTDLNLYTPTKTDSGKHYIWKNNTYSLEGGQLLTFATDYYTYKTNLGLFDICNGTFTDNVLSDTDNGLNGKYFYYDGNDLCVSYLDNSLCVIKRYNGSETKILNTFLERTLCMTAINKGFTIDSFYIKFYTIDWDNSSCTLTDTIDLHIYYPSSGSYEYIDNAYYQPLNRKIYGFRLMDYANQYYYWYFVIDVDTKQITKLKQYNTKFAISTEQAGFNGLQIIHTNQDIDFYYYGGDVVIVNNGTKSKRYMTQNLYPYSFEDSVSTEKILSYQYQSALLCSKAIARWITDPNDYVCVVYNKYNKEKEQYSFDNGGTWVDTGKTRTGSTLIETNSEDCGYSPSYEDQYLTTEALESGTISFDHDGQFPIFRRISYSKNSEEWTSGSIVSVEPGDKIMWKATNNSGYYPSTGNESHFTSTVKYKLYGNPLSLYYLDNFKNVTTLKPDMFLRIFNGKNLIDASNLALVATTLAEGCYQEMFMNCTNLTAAPALPATILASNCYKGMFYYCTSLTAAPALPATTLASKCYESMFEGCTSLTTAPSILPSITLPERCYFKMFYYCTSLTTAPTISATKLYTNCCNQMFHSCYSLTTAPTLSATKLSNKCYWAMFESCRSLNSVTCLATNRSATDCTYDWLRGVSSTGTFTKAAGVTWSSGDSGIPSGWTVVEAS